MTTETISDVLVQRGKLYGEFPGHADLSQNIKSVFRRSKNWITLDFEKKEALEMIAHKISRILNGDPNHKDSWIDIQGYAKLVSDDIEDA